MRLVAVLASTGLLVGIVLSALPQEPLPPPLSAGHHEDGGTAGGPGTHEAEAVFRVLEHAGLPLENAVLHTRRDQDPDGLLGRHDGYHSKVTFEDRRIDGGTVAVADPASVQLGGAIEVFHGTGAALARVERLRADAAHPDLAEYVYHRGRILLRLSPYLREPSADAYAAAVGASALPRSTADPVSGTV
ncbi:hypothetical protein [Streptomyces acidicola]|uniref:hypothetical protein n=1 Tax=Streptomyces acidicola TaxID=2596892 RepID=UPI00380F1EE1